MKKRRLRLAFVAIVPVGVAATVFAFSSHPARITRAASPSVPVVIDGKFARLLVHDGERVHQGQLIGFLDSSGYEADLRVAENQLRELQTQTQQAIKPMEALPGIAGFLPPTVPRPQYVQVPVAQKPPINLKKAGTVSPPAPRANENAEDAYKTALKDRQAKQEALEAATQALAKQSAAVADAQKARDALRPKITQAEADAMQAEKKAAGSKDLLDQGAISAKRADELLADREATRKTLESLKGQVDAAEKALSDAQAAQQRAKEDLDKASAMLKSADEALAKTADTPPPPPAKPASAPKATKPQQMTTKIGMRRMPLVARSEEAPAIPLKVFVDAKTMKTSEARVAELQKRIEQLKARIAECKLVAPASGILHIEADGAMSVRL